MSTARLMIGLVSSNGIRLTLIMCFKCVDRLHLLELGAGAFLFFCACYDVSFGRNHYFIYLYLQAIAFFIVGFGYIGTFVPN